MIRLLKRVAVIVACLLLLAVAYVGGAIPGVDGCVFRSVDKTKYVAGNDAVFRTLRLPQWLRERRANTWVHGVSARNSCLPIEDEGGKPFGAYVTTYVFLRRRGGPPIGFDPRILGRDWTREPNTDAVFRRGYASLSIATNRDGVLLSIDYRAYA